MALVFIQNVAAQTTSCKAPLPDDLIIIPPAQGVSPELARFSGLWRGTWETKLGLDVVCSYLAVELVDETGDVRLTFGWGGEAGTWPGFASRLAKMNGEVLEFVITGTTYSFWFDPDGSMRGSGDDSFGGTILMRMVSPPI